MIIQVLSLTRKHNYIINNYQDCGIQSCIEVIM